MDVYTTNPPPKKNKRKNKKKKRTAAALWWKSLPGGLLLLFFLYSLHTGVYCLSLFFFFFLFSLCPFFFPFLFRFRFLTCPSWNRTSLTHSLTLLATALFLSLSLAFFYMAVQLIIVETVQNGWEAEEEETAAIYFDGLETSGVRHAEERKKKPPLESERGRPNENGMRPESVVALFFFFFFFFLPLDWWPVSGHTRLQSFINNGDSFRVV